MSSRKLTFIGERESATNYIMLSCFYNRFSFILKRLNKAILHNKAAVSRIILLMESHIELVCSIHVKFWPNICWGTWDSRLKPKTSLDGRAYECIINPPSHSDPNEFDLCLKWVKFALPRVCTDLICVLSPRNETSASIEERIPRWHFA